MGFPCSVIGAKPKSLIFASVSTKFTEFITVKAFDLLVSCLTMIFLKFSSVVSPAEKIFFSTALPSPPFPSLPLLRCNTPEIKYDLSVYLVAFSTLIEKPINVLKVGIPFSCCNIYRSFLALRGVLCC